MHSIAGARPDAPVGIAPNSVRSTLLYLAEYTAAGERAFLRYVEHADVTGLARVRDVKLFFIRRETKPIRHVKILGHDDGRLGLWVEMEHEVAFLLLCFTSGQPIGRVREPDRSVGFHHGIIRRVEFLTVVTIHERFQRAIRI